MLAVRRGAHMVAFVAWALLAWLWSPAGSITGWSLAAAFVAVVAYATAPEDDE